jgi:hypothetical protein
VPRFSFDALLEHEPPERREVAIFTIVLQLLLRKQRLRQLREPALLAILKAVVREGRPKRRSAAIVKLPALRPARKEASP